MFGIPTPVELKGAHGSEGRDANIKRFIKLPVQVRLEILLEEFANAFGLQHFGVTWIYLVQNGPVYKFNKLPVIDGMALTDCHINTVIKTWSLIQV